ncbi:hypothetical protein [Clostridium vincentii]|uniref:DUF3006 domain-containing protein n=1 Tax=Clostridium vincentii TaxID=52704 RepID=A0A2T0BHL2_9CLOT|nr:hypothetical protein [Clostridium vincentii]PRR83302.1 hypothetical protein CLVI_11010 [Clostridium vincentii]
MRAILIDKNIFDAFVSLEDGTIISVPLGQVNPANIGDTLHLSNTINCINNSVASDKSVDKLIDFF